MTIDINNYIPIDLNIVKTNLNIIKMHTNGVLCTNNDNVSLLIPNHKLDILFDRNCINKDIFTNFYIEKSSKEVIDIFLNRLKKEDRDYHNLKDINQFFKVYRDCMPDSEETKKFEYDILEVILKETPKERFISLNNYIDILDQYLNEGFDENSIQYILDIISELAFIERINLIHLLNAMKDTINQPDFDNVEYYDTQYISNNLILVVSKLINKIYPDIDLFYKIDNFKCRNVIGHGNRVFITFIEFLLYYNDEVSKQLSLKSIINFNTKYYNYYKRVFENYNIDKKVITFDDIFKNGFKKLSIERIANFAAGAFWHDVVKVKELDYLNVKKSKDYSKSSTSHAIKGYQFLRYFRNYNNDISLIVGMHHEYYGYGYSILSNIISTYLKENKTLSPAWLVSYYSEDIYSLDSLSFFPAKVLEIVDLFDTIVIPQKNYSRKGLSVKEAIDLMYVNYIENEVQIDPILFDLFIQFLIDVKKENIKNPFN